MKVYALFLLVTLFLTLGCNIPQENNNGKAQEQPKPGKLEATKPTDNLNRASVPAADGKTVAALYNYLKNKGWDFGPLTDVPTRMFDSEETGSFRNKENIGFLAMRFDSESTAQAKYEQINKFYQTKFGRALMARNFVVGIFGYEKGTNKPVVIALSDSDYQKLQAHLIEFIKS